MLPFLLSRSTPSTNSPTTTQCLKDFALGNADRYAPAGKALRLVEHHAPFFQRQLTAEARATYDKMHAIYARVSQVSLCCAVWCGVGVVGSDPGVLLASSTPS